MESHQMVFDFIGQEELIFGIFSFKHPLNFHETFNGYPLVTKKVDTYRVFQMLYSPNDEVRYCRNLKLDNGVDKK